MDLNFPAFATGVRISGVATFDYHWNEMEVWVGTKKFVFGRGYYICSYSFSKSTKDVFNLQDDFIFIFLFLVFNAYIIKLTFLLLISRARVTKGVR
jgi:hypothetical protein